MYLYCLAIGFSNSDWWALATRCNCTFSVRASFILACSHQLIVFWHGCIISKSERFYTQSDACKKDSHAFTCGACTSCRIQSTTRNEASKLRVTSPAGCRLTYLQFAGEFTRGVIADCLQLWVYFLAISGILACSCKYFWGQLRGFLPAIVGIFACVREFFYFCMPVAGKFAWVAHVWLPVKNQLYSGKSACSCRQFACILCDVLAAETRVNLPIFTGKLQVTHVNCVKGLFTCSPQLKLRAFGGNFARVSFTVYHETIGISVSGGGQNLTLKTNCFSTSLDFQSLNWKPTNPESQPTLKANQPVTRNLFWWSFQLKLS